MEWGFEYGTTTVFMLWKREKRVIWSLLYCMNNKTYSPPVFNNHSIELFPNYHNLLQFLGTLVIIRVRSDYQEIL